METTNISTEFQVTVHFDELENPVEAAEKELYKHLYTSFREFPGTLVYFKNLELLKKPSKILEDKLFLYVWIKADLYFVEKEQITDLFKQC